MNHDVYSCECHETCSWCVEAVLDSTLREAPDGARLCRACWRELRASATR